MKKCLLTISALLISAFSVCMHAQSIDGEFAAKKKSVLLNKAPTSQQAERVSLIYGFSSTELSIRLYSSEETELGSGAVFPAEQMENFKGNQITSIFVGTTTNITDVVAFVRSDMYGANIVEGRIHNDSIIDGWNEIILDTPYDIDGSSIMIGFTGKVKPYERAIWFDGYVTAEGGSWCYEDGIWYDFINKGWGAACVLALVEGENLPQNDLKVSDPVIQGGVADIMDFFSASVEVTNCGINTVSSFFIEAYVGDEAKPQRSRTIEESLTMGSSTTINFSLEPIMEGYQDVRVVVSQINGDKEDTNPEDNVGISTIYGYSDKTEFFERKILLQQFSTAFCPNCPSGHTNIESAISKHSKKDNIIWHTHHSGYTYDDFTTDLDKEMEVFYGTSPWAPAAMVDRTYFDNTLAGPVGYVSEYIMTNTFNKAFSIPAFIKPTIIKEYNEDTRELKVKVAIDAAISPLPNQTDLRLNIFLQESNIIGQQLGALTNVYYHDNVHRSSLTGVWGEQIVIPVGESVSEEYSIIINDRHKIDNMHIVAFIANHGSTIKNCMVYNADFCKLTDRETSSVNTLKSGSNSIMISNGNLIIESDYGFGYISNMGGSKIAGLNGEKVINVSHLSKGIYIVVIDNVSYKIVL